MRGVEASSASAREGALREQVAGMRHALQRHVEDAQRQGAHMEQLAAENRGLKVRAHACVYVFLHRVLQGVGVVGEAAGGVCVCVCVLDDSLGFPSTPYSSKPPWLPF